MYLPVIQHFYFVKFGLTKGLTDSDKVTVPYRGYLTFSV